MTISRDLIDAPFNANNMNHGRDWLNANVKVVYLTWQIWNLFSSCMEDLTSCCCNKWEERERRRISDRVTSQGPDKYRLKPAQFICTKSSFQKMESTLCFDRSFHHEYIVHRILWLFYSLICMNCTYQFCRPELPTAAASIASYFACK